MLLVPGGSALAQRSGTEETQAVEKVKAKIAKLGVGEKARVQIKIRNGQKLKGYISSAGQDDFTLTERDSGQKRTLAYSDVVEIKKRGGLSTGAKLAIAGGITVAVVAVIAIHISHHLFDNFGGIRVP